MEGDRDSREKRRKEARHYIGVAAVIALARKDYETADFGGRKLGGEGSYFGRRARASPLHKLDAREACFVNRPSVEGPHCRGVYSLH